MRHLILGLTVIACTFLPMCATATAQKTGSSARRVKTPANTLREVSPEGKIAAEHALARLRTLRDGWNDVNRQFIKQDFVAADKLDTRQYEVQYLEARAAVSDAIEELPNGDLRIALLQAIDLFNDLEAIIQIVNRTSPLSTTVRVADVFPYLKKYNVPYESGMARGSYSITIHQDFLMSYILPIRYARVNRVEVLLGRSPRPVPPSPTYEQMFRVPKRVPTLDRSTITLEELKGIIHRIIEAKLRGDSDQVSVTLDDSFIFSGRGGLRWDKRQFLKTIILDPTVKSFEVEQAELSFRNELPIITAIVRYESRHGESKSRNNTFNFANRGGKWVITRWSSF